MQTLLNSLWSDTSAGPMIERSRFPVRGGSHGYYPFPGTCCSGGCTCPSDWQDGCCQPPLLVSFKLIIDNSFLDDNFDPKALRSALLISQDILQTELGICTMNKLYDFILNLNEIEYLGSPVGTLQLIDLYILPVLVYKVLSELAVPISFKEKSQGVINISTQDYQSAGIQNITYLKLYYDYRYEFYLKRLRNKLRCIGIYCTCNLLPKTSIVL